MIQPIVEGQGEVEAVPHLLRRILSELGIWDVKVGKPRRCPRDQIVREPELKKMVTLATQAEDLEAILILFDSDDDCARDLIPPMKQWATEIAANTPCAIVLARREYEAWFLAALESLRGKYSISLTATYDMDPEAKRGAKEALERHLPKGRKYDPTADQSKMTAGFDIQMAYKRSSSFRKLVREVCRILTEMGYRPIIPEHWESG